MKRIAIIFGAALIVALAASCHKQSAESTKPSEQENDSARITIGFSIDTLAIERWRRDCDVFLNTAKVYGII